ncbi:MAG TPA: hypothetical protein VM431_10315 [Phycisphaerae bacterium]|nr:hypothetical protein [Phycisphaerae bacterium]
MRDSGRLLLAVWCVVGVVVSSGAAAGAAESINPATLRESAGARVCLVTVDGPLGLPAAYASGFLLGGGKFVVTDLASLAQPGVRQVRLQFPDGTTAVSSQFGMADPATGLAAILVEGAKAGTGGLALTAAEAVGEADVPAVVLGWKWAQALDATAGHLAPAVVEADPAGRAAAPATSSATAASSETATPSATAFLTFLGSTTPEVASGAPVVDASGSVLGVLVQVVGSQRSLVVPAEGLRQALLAAGTELKPLAEMPRSLLPVAVQDLPGQPTTPQEFANAVRAVKSRSRCKKCNGSGKIVITRVVGYRKVGGLARPIYKKETESCKDCAGDGVICGKGMYDYFARMAEGATRLLASPGTDDKVRKVAVTNSSALLDALAKVGADYRQALAEQARDDLADARAALPRGIVVYAQVRETVGGPAGPHMLLLPFRSTTLLALGSDRVGRPLGEEEGAADATLREGDWIIFAGVAQAATRLGGKEVVLLKPFGWTYGPTLGPRPKTAEGGPRKERREKPRKEGEPSFFGL